MTTVRLPRKIVLCGVSKSGKSTLGDFFTKNFGHVSKAFADPLKHACKEIFGFSDDHLFGPSEMRNAPYDTFEHSGWCFECNRQCHGPERKELEDERGKLEDWWLCPSCGAKHHRYITPREALQTMGTAWGRKLCHNLWAQSCFATMYRETSYVVTDCRFDNERNQAWRYGALTVLLLRGIEESTDPHPSEAEIRQMAHYPNLFHVVLDNRQGSAFDNATKLMQLLDAYGASAHLEIPEVRRIQWRDYPIGQLRTA